MPPSVRRGDSPPEIDPHIVLSRVMKSPSRRPRCTAFQAAGKTVTLTLTQAAGKAYGKGPVPPEEALFLSQPNPSSQPVTVTLTVTQTRHPNS